MARRPPHVKVIVSQECLNTEQAELAVLKRSLKFFKEMLDERLSALPGGTTSSNVMDRLQERISYYESKIHVQEELLSWLKVLPECANGIDRKGTVFRNIFFMISISSS